MRLRADGCLLAIFVYLHGSHDARQLCTAVSSDTGRKLLFRLVRSIGTYSQSAPSHPCDSLTTNKAIRSSRQQRALSACNKWRDVTRQDFRWGDRTDVIIPPSDMLHPLDPISHTFSSFLFHHFFPIHDIIFIFHYNPPLLPLSFTCFTECLRLCTWNYGYDVARI